MRYLMMHRLDESAPEASNPGPEFIAKMGAFIEEIGKTGILLATDGVQHSKTGAKVRHSHGKTTVTDGPFTEAREVIGGYAVLDVKSRDEALEWASRYATLFDEVEIEVRLIAEFDDLPEEAKRAFNGEV